MAKLPRKPRTEAISRGHWQLVTEDGATYVLDSASLGAEGDVTLVDGVHVEIDGTVNRQALSFAMTGPLLTAKSIKKA